MSKNEKSRRKSSFSCYLLNFDFQDDLHHHHIYWRMRNWASKWKRSILKMKKKKFDVQSTEKVSEGKTFSFPHSLEVFFVNFFQYIFFRFSKSITFNQGWGEIFVWFHFSLISYHREEKNEKCFEMEKFRWHGKKEENFL
jgi:trehalose utilization protein